MLSNITFLMIIAVFDSSPLTLWINCSFYRAMLCSRGTSHDPVSVSVCLTHAGVLLQRINVGSHKYNHTIAQGLWFSDAKDIQQLRPRSPHAGAPNASVMGQNRPLLTNSWLYLENGTR